MLDERIYDPIFGHVAAIKKYVNVITSSYESFLQDYTVVYKDAQKAQTRLNIVIFDALSKAERDIENTRNSYQQAIGAAPIERLQTAARLLEELKTRVTTNADAEIMRFTHFGLRPIEDALDVLLLEPKPVSVPQLAPEPIAQPADEKKAKLRPDRSLEDFLLVKDKQALIGRIGPVLNNPTDKKAAIAIRALQKLKYVNIISGELAMFCRALNNAYSINITPQNVSLLVTGERSKKIPESDIDLMADTLR